MTDGVWVYHGSNLKGLIKNKVSVSSYGVKSWWLNGKRHREDGPAVIYPDGYRTWFLNGEELYEGEFVRRISSACNDGRREEPFSWSNIKLR